MVELNWNTITGLFMKESTLIVYILVTVTMAVIFKINKTFGWNTRLFNYNIIIRNSMQFYQIPI